jgi:hypothetical protein
MLDEEKIQERMRELRALIRIGKERIARHSPVWAVYLASETLRALDEALDDLEGDLGGTREPEEVAPVRRAV